MKQTSRPGFTLLELLLAIALIALIGTALIAGSVSLLRDKPTSPDEVFWKVVSEARKAALTEEVEVRVSFDDEHKAFVIDDGTDPKSVPIPNPAPDLAVDFVPANSTQVALIGGTLTALDKMPSVSFYPDGTCIPFSVQIRSRGGAHLTEVDPWTCAQMLKPQPSS